MVLGRVVLLMKTALVGPARYTAPGRTPSFLTWCDGKIEDTGGAAAPTMEAAATAGSGIAR